jgi:C1A family cysteine protease
LGEYSPGIFISKGRDSGSWISSERKLRKEENVYISEDEDTIDTSTVTDVPLEKNWVEEGAVTNVKNQWFCGACWAFSAVGAIEGARFIQTGNLTDLSIQQLIDCDLTDMG